jgi:hypothetical protein
MSILTALFGFKGTVRFEATRENDDQFTAKMKFECWGIDRDDLKKEIINALYVQEGIRVKSVKILGIVEH